MLGILVPLVVVAGFADWAFQLDSVIRATLLAALAGGVIYLGYRRVLRPLFVKFADLDIAMRIDHIIAGLETFPNRGAYPKELLELGIRDYREVYFQAYRIIYRVLERDVIVVLIADGRRDMQTLLTSRTLGI